MVEGLAGPGGPGAPVPALTGSRCPACGAPAFPARRICAACGAGGQEPLPLPRRGAVYVATVLHIRPPAGFPSPYAVGYVRLDGVDLMVPACFGPAARPLPRGARVELVRVAPWYAGAAAPAPGSGTGAPGEASAGPAYVFAPVGGDPA